MGSAARGSDERTRSQRRPLQVPSGPSCANEHEKGHRRLRRPGQAAGKRAPAGQSAPPRLRQSSRVPQGHKH
eukprot:3905182-Pyramimonas_sp.AAC.1